jgi:hypothetical protein
MWWVPDQPGHIRRQLKKKEHTTHRSNTENTYNLVCYDRELSHSLISILENKNPTHEYLNIYILLDSAIYLFGTKGSNNATSEQKSSVWE